MLSLNTGVHTGVQVHILRSHFEYAFMFSELGQTLWSAMTLATSYCVLPSMHTLNWATARVCVCEWTCVYLRSTAVVTCGTKDKMNWNNKPPTLAFQRWNALDLFSRTSHLWPCRPCTGWSRPQPGQCRTGPPRSVFRGRRCTASSWVLVPPHGGRGWRRAQQSSKVSVLTSTHS